MLEGIFGKGIRQAVVIYVEARGDRRQSGRCRYAAAGIAEDVPITPGLDRPIEGQGLFGEQIRAPAGMDVENQQHRRLIFAFISNIEPGAYLHAALSLNEPS